MRTIAVIHRIRLTPDSCVIFLLVAESLLWLSDQWGWQVWHKGYAVILGVVAAGAAMVAMLVWWAIALILRRRFQYSIWSLLVLAVVVSLPCRWFAVEMKQAREQKLAVNEVHQFGGGVEFDWCFQGDEWLEDVINEPPEPLWLRNALGENFFDRVYLAWLPTNSSLDTIRHFPDLWYLILSESNVTDADLVALRRQPTLRRLYLYKTRISDAGLVHLAALTNLQALSLVDTNVTDYGVQRLQRALPKCKIKQ